MKLCAKCNRPMISSGRLCGRISCSPQVLESYLRSRGLDAVERGKNGRREIQLSKLHESSKEVSAPSHKCFAFWAVAPSSWPIIGSAVQLLDTIKRNTYRAPAKSAEWLGALSNAKAGRYGASIRYSGISPLNEFLRASDERFKRLIIADQLREKEASNASVAY